jgi:hypothetical protein
VRLAAPYVFISTRLVTFLIIIPMLWQALYGGLDPGLGCLIDLYCAEALCLDQWSDAHIDGTRVFSDITPAPEDPRVMGDRQYRIT